MIGSLLSAIAFLTRLRVPTFVHADVNQLQRSTRWFPLVGLVIGCICAGCAWVAQSHLPPVVVSVLLLVLDAFLTGALHLDGLADMADGFGGGRTRDDVLRIMRDHAIGSYGAVALILLLFFKAACFTSLVASRHGLWVLFVAPALARWSILLLSRSAPYARADGRGTGALSESISRFDFVFATVFCAVLPFVFGIRRTLACWLAVAVVTVVISWTCRRRIGGITGDTLGANVVLSEAAQFGVALLLSL